MFHPSDSLEISFKLEQPFQLELPFAKRNFDEVKFSVFPGADLFLRAVLLFSLFQSRSNYLLLVGIQIHCFTEAIFTSFNCIKLNV